MKLRRFLPLLVVISLLMGCLPTAGASSVVPFRSLSQLVYADNNTGATDDVTIHAAGRVRFYVINTNGVEDLTITVQKKGLFGIWSGPISVNGATRFYVGAGESKNFDTNGADWAPGTYRFVAESDAGYDYVYSVNVRELDYTP